MTTTRLTGTLALIISCLIGGTTTAEAIDYHHIDRLALRLQGQTRALQSHLRVRFRHAPQFGHLMHDANELAANPPAQAQRPPESAGVSVPWFGRGPVALAWRSRS